MREPDLHIADIQHATVADLFDPNTRDTHLIGYVFPGAQLAVQTDLDEEGKVSWAPVVTVIGRGHTVEFVVDGIAFSERSGTPILLWAVA